MNLREHIKCSVGATDTRHGLMLKYQDIGNDSADYEPMRFQLLMG